MSYISGTNETKIDITNIAIDEDTIIVNDDENYLEVGNIYDDNIISVDTSKLTGFIDISTIPLDDVNIVDNGGVITLNTDLKIDSLDSGGDAIEIKKDILPGVDNSYALGDIDHRYINIYASDYYLGEDLIPSSIVNYNSELNNLDTWEIQQIENIGFLSIPYSKWDMLSQMDQPTKTTSTPTFAGLIIDGVEIDTRVTSLIEANGQPCLTTDDVKFNDMTLYGDLIVNGTTTTLNSGEIDLKDNLVIINSENINDITDSGVLHKYVDGTTKYSGLVRRAADNFYYLIGECTSPTDPIGTATAMTTINVENIILGGEYINSYISDICEDVTGNLLDITDAEISQITNIDTETISNTQWSYLGNLDQGVSTGSSVVFSGLTIGVTTLSDYIDNRITAVSHNPFNQSLDTTDDVTFDELTITNMTNQFLNLYTSNAGDITDFGINFQYVLGGITKYNGFYYDDSAGYWKTLTEITDPDNPCASTTYNTFRGDVIYGTSFRNYNSTSYYGSFNYPSRMYGSYNLIFAGSSTYWYFGSSELYPSNNTISLGTSAKKWGEFYLDGSINFTTNTLTDTTVGFIDDLDQHLVTTSDVEFKSVSTATLNDLKTIDATTSSTLSTALLTGILSENYLTKGSSTGGLTNSVISSTDTLLYFSSATDANLTLNRASNTDEACIRMRTNGGGGYLVGLNDNSTTDFVIYGYTDAAYALRIDTDGHTTLKTVEASDYDGTVFRSDFYFIVNCEAGIRAVANSVSGWEMYKFMVSHKVIVEGFIISSDSESITTAEYQFSITNSTTGYTKYTDDDISLDSFDVVRAPLSEVLTIDVDDVYTIQCYDSNVITGTGFAELAICAYGHYAI